VITYIDFVSDYYGDWAGIYVNFQMKYQGHSIPQFKWLEILKEVSGTDVEIRTWETAMGKDSTYSSYPMEFMDLPLFGTQYQLKQTSGDEVCIVDGK